MTPLEKYIRPCDFTEEDIDEHHTEIFEEILAIAMDYADPVEVEF